MGEEPQNEIVEQKSENEEKKSNTIILFKERVAGTIGVSIILVTFFLLIPSLIALTPSLETAQAIYSLFSGWIGVILGYYFGTIPTEKAAEKVDAANRTAATADANLSVVSSMVQTRLEDIKKIGITKRIDARLNEEVFVLESIKSTIERNR